VGYTEAYQKNLLFFAISVLAGAYVNIPARLRWVPFGDANPHTVACLWIILLGVVILLYLNRYQVAIIVGRGRVGCFVGPVSGAVYLLVDRSCADTPARHQAV
jgi:hypothetical protein